MDPGVSRIVVSSLKSARRHPDRFSSRPLPTPHVIVVLASSFLFAAGHHLQAPREFAFPFVQWNMFSVPEDPSRVTYFEYRGVREDGSRVALNPTRLFPPMRHARLSAAIWARLREEAEDAEIVELSRSLKDLLAAVGQAYNRTRPDRPALATEVIRSTMDLDGGGRPQTGRRPIATVVFRKAGEGP